VSSPSSHHHQSSNDDDDDPTTLKNQEDGHPPPKKDDETILLTVDKGEEIVRPNDNDNHTPQGGNYETQSMLTNEEEEDEVLDGANDGDKIITNTQDDHGSTTMEQGDKPLPQSHSELSADVSTDDPSFQREEPEEQRQEPGNNPQTEPQQEQPKTRQEAIQADSATVEAYGEESTTNRVLKEAIEPLRHQRQPQQQQRQRQQHQYVVTDDSKFHQHTEEPEVEVVENDDGLVDQTLGEEQESRDESENDECDDRSLLDVFGEQCKEFLTQKMIPETDEECHWDWRSLRCENACECEFQGRWGDYHLGRSCRRSRFDGHERELCIPVDPALVLREAPIPKRVISLVSQTLDIVTTGVHRLIQRLRSKIIQLWEQQILDRLCAENWALEQRVLSEQQHRQNFLSHSKDSNTTCIPASMALTLQNTRSFWERNLCGPSITDEYPVCEHSTASRPGGTTTSSFPTATSSPGMLKFRNKARQRLNLQ